MIVSWPEERLLVLISNLPLRRLFETNPIWPDYNYDGPPKEPMELGYLLYFLVVFVFGGIALTGLAVFFCWEIFTHRQRTPWSNRTRRAQVVIVLLGCLFVWLLFIPLRMLWVTRLGAIAGSYTSAGVWGTASLTMHPDGTFVEVWHFRNVYNGRPEGEGESRGTWRDDGRDWLTRNIVFMSFKDLAERDRDHRPSNIGANVMGYGGITQIEVDSGADIVFRK